MAHKHIQIFDTTLRDGEQVPGCQLNTDEKIEVGDQWSLRNWQTEFGDVSRRVAIEYMQLHNLSDEIDLLMEYENIYSRVFKN